MAKLKSAGIYEYFWNSISKIPIKRIDFNSKREKATHDRLVALTVELEATADRLARAKIETETRAAKQRIKTLEDEAEQLIAGLYGLSADQQAQLG